MGQRGPRKTPTNIIQMKGNPGKRAINHHEPKPERMTTCPNWLSSYARTEWRRLAPELERLGLLTSADRAAMAGYCESYARWRQAEEIIRFQLQAARELAVEEINETDPMERAAKKAAQLSAKIVVANGGLVSATEKGNIIQHPMVGIANQAKKDMLKFAGEMGLSPAARSRISIDRAPKQSDFLGDLDRTTNAG